MSTRCQVGIYSNKEQNQDQPNVLIYRHTDGYPEGILSEITDYVDEFIAERGDDPEYLAARLTAMLCETCPSIGVGGPDCKHTDIEFYYRVDGDTGKVTPYKGCWPNEYDPDAQFTEIGDTEPTLLAE